MLLTPLIENFYPDPSSRPKYIEVLIRILAADESSQVHSYISFLLDSKPVTSGPPEEFEAHSKRFAIFSKPPRFTSSQTDSDIQSLKERLDDIMINGDGKREYEHNSPQSQPIDTPKDPNTFNPEPNPASAPSKTSPPIRPRLIHGNSAETTHSGTSRGGDSQASPATNETESPQGQTRAVWATRINRTLMSEPPYTIELSTLSDPIQSTNIPLLTPPGLERRISIDAISNHSDSSDSSGHSRVDTVPRRAALHRISSDPSVSVASG